MKEDRELHWFQCEEPANSLSRITDNHMEWITYFFSSHSCQVYRRVRDEGEGIVWEVAIEQPKSTSSYLDEKRRNEIKIEGLEKLAEEFRIRGMKDAHQRTLDRIKEIQTYGS